MDVCARCAAWGRPLTLTGILWFCGACVPTPCCEPAGRHTWRAGDDQGRWGCTQCGAVLSSQDWVEHVVQAPVF